MIMASFQTPAGRDGFFLGLTEANIDRLIRTGSIQLTSLDFGAVGLSPLSMVICYGRSEVAISKVLEDYAVQVVSVVR